MFSFPSPRASEVGKKFQGFDFWVFLVGWVLIGKIGVCQQWKYTQECRSDIVLGKTSTMESDSNNSIDNSVCLLRKYFTSN